MPSLAHEIAVARIRDQPRRFSMLAQVITHRAIGSTSRPADTAQRLANPAEVRPDVLLASGRHGPWDAVEVQRRIDRDKEHQWPLLVGILLARRRSMGDLWVVTTKSNVARWAQRGFRARGPRGTELLIIPKVLLLTEKDAWAILSAREPELAFFAAWAMEGRRGQRALRLVEAAIELAMRGPKALREQQVRDILGVLDPKLRLKIEEKFMTKRKDLVAPWVLQLERKLEARGEARGIAKGEARGIAKGEARGIAKGEARGQVEAKRAALFTIFEARGLRPSKQDRELIEGCARRTTLDAWIKKAATAESVREVLGPRQGLLRRTEPRASAPYAKRAKRDAAGKAPRPTVAKKDAGRAKRKGAPS